MIYDEVALWGFTDENSADEIWTQIFSILEKSGGWVSVATINNGLPDSRVISIQHMSDGYIYLMTSRGKPFYAQLKAIPRISVATLLEDTHHSLRINATVEECKDPARYKEYAKGNPGTMKMYRFNTDLIVLFKLVRGYGEIFHLYRDDMVRRLRFGFGGETPPELSYYITDECTGCGACFDSCAEHSIYRTDDGKYHIRSMDCDDCGICYTRCPLAGTALKNRYWE